MASGEISSEKYYQNVHKKFFECLKPGSDYSRIPQTFDINLDCFDAKFDCKIDFRTIIYDAYFSAIFDTTPPEKVAALIPQFFGKHSPLISYCACLLATFDSLTQGGENAARHNFSRLILHSARFLGEENIKEFIDPETMENCGLVKSAKFFNQKIVRLKTKLFYKQKKFNLIREESEGYSKLIVGFQSLPKMLEKQGGIEVFISRVLSLIGCFSLDPYRSFDLLMEYLSFSSLKNSDLIVKAFLNFSGISCLREILTFKLCNLPNSPKFWNTVVVFIKSELIDLSLVYEHLTPQDEELEFKMNIIDKKDDELSRKAAGVTLQESTKLNKQPTSVVRFPDCDKILLLAAFIRAHDMKSFDYFLSKFKLELLKSFPSVIQALLDAVSEIIEPYYNNLGLNLIPKTVDETVEFKDLIDSHLFKLLFYLGFNIYEDTILFTKLIRLFSSMVKMNLDDSKFMSSIYMTICKCFLPGLTQSDSNCVLSDELWGLIKQFPYAIRYKFYSYVEMISYNKIRQLIRTKVMIVKNVKFICKRITKDTVKLCGRQMGKLSHSNPIVVLSEIMNQVCCFETLISPIVECLKILTPLSFDILSFEIIQYLSVNSVTLTSKITAIPDVIQNIGTFTATVMRKFQVPMAGVFQYISNQLKDANPLDLIVLREILHKMTGYDELHLTNQQIETLSGSETLQEEYGVGLGSKSLKKYGSRMKESLVESNLTFPLYFLMCQQKNRLIYDPNLNEIHIKMIGHLHDQCHKTLVQYGRFISKYIQRQDFISLVSSSIHNLYINYGLSIDCIFFLVRNVFRHDVSNIPKNMNFIQAANVFIDYYFHGLLNIIPKKPENSMINKLVCLFWLLDLYDIFVPRSRYEECLTKCNSTLLTIDDSKEIASKKAKEKERIANVIKQLNSDRDSQMLHVAYIKQLVLEVINDSFSKATKSDFLSTFYQISIYPRCIFSPCDAIYSSMFIFMLHDLRCIHFNSLALLDKIFGENTHVISSLSETEANNFGIFLNNIWQTLIPWHGSKSVFEQNCSKHPGFSIISKSEHERSDNYEFENFRHLMYKWQYKQMKSFIFAFESKEYISIRNTIIILTKISSCYPRVINHKNTIEKHIKKLVEEEKDNRPDLYALVICYSGILKNIKDVVEESEYHNKDQSKDGKARNLDTESNKSNQISLATSKGEEPAKISVGHADEIVNQSEKHVHNSHENDRHDTHNGNHVEDSASSNSNERNELTNNDRKRTYDEKEELRSKRKKEAENEYSSSHQQKSTDTAHHSNTGETERNTGGKSRSDSSNRSKTNQSDDNQHTKKEVKKRK